jgi:hypothetical protein
MRIRRKAGLLVGVVACQLLASACSGPRSAIDVTMKEVPGDVAIGAKPVVVLPEPAPAHVNPVPVAFPPFFSPPPPIEQVGVPTADPVPVPTATAVACGTAGPTAVSKNPAPNNISTPPEASSLVYRDKGTFTVTSSDGVAHKGDYPVQSTRAVVSKPVGDGTFLFTVTEQQGLLSATATTYHLVPSKGLYLRQVVTLQPDGASDRFATDTDTLLMLPLPVSVGAQVGGSAVDSSTATNLTFAGTVTGHTRVDACGTLLDAIEVQVTAGRITAANRAVSFTATYAIGTQYGGLSLADHVTYDCDANNLYCDQNRNIHLDNVASVTSEPPLVRAS